MTKDIETGVSMYDFNRANMGKLPLLDEEGIEGAKNVVRKFLTRQTENFYYMLLNHENRYFTLFEFTHNIKSDDRINTMADDVIIIGCHVSKFARISRLSVVEFAVNNNADG